MGDFVYVNKLLELEIMQVYVFEGVGFKQGLFGIDIIFYVICFVVFKVMRDDFLCCFLLVFQIMGNGGIDYGYVIFIFFVFLVYDVQVGINVVEIVVDFGLQGWILVFDVFEYWMDFVFQLGNDFGFVVGVEIFQYVFEVVFGCSLVLIE